jgi:hypothetical protein
MARTIPLFDEDLVLQNKTFEQLKGSGGLRLIRNIQTQNKLAHTIKIISLLKLVLHRCNFRIVVILFQAFDELFDAAIMQEIMRSPREMPSSIPNNQFKLLSDDPKVINRFCTRYHVIYSTKRVTSNFAKYLTSEASELIKHLQKEYHMK